MVCTVYYCACIVLWCVMGVCLNSERGRWVLWLCGSASQGAWHQTPDYTWHKGSDYSSNKKEFKREMRKSHRKHCPLDSNVPTAPDDSFEVQFLSPSATKSFLVWLEKCRWCLVSIYAKFYKISDCCWWTFFCVIVHIKYTTVTYLKQIKSLKVFKY